MSRYLVGLGLFAAVPILYHKFNGWNHLESSVELENELLQDQRLLCEIKSKCTVLMYEAQCFSLVRSVLKFRCPDHKRLHIVEFLKDLSEFLGCFGRRTYFSTTWMKVNFVDEINALQEKWKVLSGESLPPVIETEADKSALKSLLSSILEEYGPLKLHESRVFNDEMIESFKTLLQFDLSKSAVQLREVNLNFLSYKKDIDSILGSGQFGQVFTGTMRDVKVAIKSVPLVAIRDVHDHNCQQLKNEALILQSHSFPGVIRMFGVDNADKPTLLVMELAVCSLYTALHEKLDMKLTDERKLSILLSLCGTFSFLHSIKVVHRDIKSMNILMMPDGNVKVTDFGLAKSAVTEGTLGVDMKGTLSYLAPELLLSTSRYEYTEATDMYAFGILMNEVMTGKKPYENPEILPAKMQASGGTLRPELYNCAANAIVPLIEESWDANPSKRPSFFNLCWRLRWCADITKECLDVSLPTVLVKNVFTASSLLSGFYSGDMVGSMRHGKGMLRNLEGSKFEGNWHHNELHGWGKLSANFEYEGNFVNSRMEGTGKATSKTGEVYEGEFKNNQREGHGVLKYADGTVYDGEWKNNEKEGRGVMKLSDGDVYEGEWKSGLFEGLGVAKYASGSVYDGEWKNSQSEGRGVMKYADGNVYEGEWKSGLFEGHGVMKYVDGSVYDGEWKHDKKEGHGAMTYASGNVYDGEWKNNQGEGRGVMKYADGKVYEGEWKSGLFEGHGVMKYASGSVYDGEWKNSQREGRGVMKYASGNVFEGEWKSGLLEGHGVMKYADGSVYDGEWKHDKKEGHGAMTNASGSVYDGEWKNNQREGRGVMKYASGNVFEDEWKSGLFEGHGVMKNVGGTVYNGEWRSDQPNGLGSLVVVNGIFEGVWLNGVLINDPDELVHFGIGCDDCSMIPIIGHRYHGVDTDFDLCLQCYENQKKSLTMTMIKITFDTVNQKLIQVRVTEDGSNDVQDWP